MTSRKLHRIAILTLVAALLLPELAPAHQPKPYGKVLVTYNQQLAEGCRFIGDVEATSIWGGIFDRVGRNRVKKALRKRAYKQGGNLVVVAQRPGPRGFVSYGAMVFVCPLDDQGRPAVQPKLHLLNPPLVPDKPTAARPKPEAPTPSTPPGGTKPGTRPGTP